MKKDFAIGAKEVCIGRRITYLLTNDEKKTGEREIHLVKGEASPSNSDE